MRIIVYPSSGNNYDEKSKLMISCTCEFFKYYADEALTEKDASIRFKDPANPELNQGITNPDLIPWTCKHVIAAIRAGAHKRKQRSKKRIKKRPKIS